MNAKTTSATATLVAAIPAAVLGIFLVLTFLNHLGSLNKLGMMFLILYAVTLAACAAVVFLPIGIMIFGPKASAAPPTTDQEAASAAATLKKPESEAEEAFEESALAGEPVLGDESAIGDDELALGIEDESGAPTSSTGEVEVVDTQVSTEMPVVVDDFDEEEFSFDEEEPPPKKKKGK